MLQCLCKFSNEFLCLYSVMIWIFALQGSRKSLFPVCTYFLPENTTLIQGNWCRGAQHQSMDPWLLSVLGHQSYKSLIFDKKNTQNTMQLYHGQMTLLFMLEARTPLVFFFFSPGRRPMLFACTTRPFDFCCSTLGFSPQIKSTFWSDTFEFPTA